MAANEAVENVEHVLLQDMTDILCLTRLEIDVEQYLGKSKRVAFVEENNAEELIQVRVRAVLLVQDVSWMDSEEDQVACLEEQQKRIKEVMEKMNIPKKDVALLVCTFENSIDASHWRRAATRLRLRNATKRDGRINICEPVFVDSILDSEIAGLSQEKSAAALQQLCGWLGIKPFRTAWRADGGNARQASMYDAPAGYSTEGSLRGYFSSGCASVFSVGMGLAREAVEGRTKAPFPFSLALALGVVFSTRYLQEISHSGS
eukprot:CAMPEP_0114613282 /NCGR_PEP_ID=MMETSP0168-20121206/5052_1 /TAXON_ID=95228 ORGANISM="Vannella sp., Strain DIVA3 517/6/12" /NCGR_SAMPLE_ID=MMETSP0168 /ASSEMBLY_ACC=CAM_ASM_000044 /LENGTH=260 /DNA_ID=CAMNT_0001824283 /DNA_START=137 /DNA_END=919 /DNA_ORIENTATION=-